LRASFQVEDLIVLSEETERIILSFPKQDENFCLQDFNLIIIHFPSLSLEQIFKDFFSLKHVQSKIGYHF